MERTPYLVGLEGGLVGRRYAVTAEGLRLGRDPENEVHIDDSGVSRQHARVLLHNGAVWVQDTGSRNGIHVNGQRVPDHKQVKEGDRIVIGTPATGAHTFTIELVAPVERAEPKPEPAQVPAPAAPSEPASRVPITLVVAGILLVAGCAGLAAALWAAR